MKASPFCTFHVASDVCEFMKQTKPEIIEPIIPQREANHRRAIGELQSGPIQMGARQVPEANYTYAVFD